MTDGIGAQRLDDPRGWLLFDYLPDALQRAEDGTQAADYGRNRPGSPALRVLGITRTREYDPYFDRAVWGFTRDATATERLLLEHLGHTLPANLVTRVQFKTETLRRRTWPQLITIEGESE